MKRIFSIITALGFVAGLQAQTLQDAQREIDNENYVKGKQILFKLAGDATANKQDIYYYLGNAFLKNDDADSAKVFYKQAVALDGKTATEYLAAGRLALLSKNRAEAKMNFDRALQTTKMKSAVTYYEVGDAYAMAEGLPLQLAMSNLEAGYALDAKNTSILLKLGDVYLDSSATDNTMGGKAMNKYEAAAEVNPKLALAQIKIGRLSVRARIYDQAIEAFNKAITIDPNYAINYKELGEAYYFTKQYDKMVSNFQKYVELSPGDAKARLYLVEMYFKNKDYEKVIDDCLKGLKADPNNVLFQRYLFYANYELKRYKEGYDAMNKYWTMAGVKPKTADYVYSGKLASQLGDTTAAFKYFETAMGDDSLNCDLLSEYGKTVFFARNYAKAAEIYASKKNNCPKFGNIDLYYLGRAYMFSNDSVNADTIFGEYIAKYPTAVDGYYWRANVQAQFRGLTKGDDFAAWPFYLKVIEIGEKNAQQNKVKLVEAYTYGALYEMEKTKDKAAAKAYLAKATELDPANQFVIDLTKELNK